MTNKDLIIEQIKLTFPDSNIQKDELIGLDFKDIGRLSLSEKLTINFNFKSHIGIDTEYLKMFFETRLKFNNAKLYFNKNSFSIYPRADDLNNDFEQSMSRAKNFIDTANVMSKFLEYL